MNQSLPTLALLLWSAAPLLAAPQFPPQDPAVQPQSPQEQLLQQLFQPAPDALNSRWVRTPEASRRQFTGFPTFPVRLQGYGNYPVDPTGAAGQNPTLTVPMLPMGVLPSAEPRTAWPAWVTSKEPLPYDPSVALLVQHVERVWWRAKDEDVSIPLFFHAKFALLTDGAAVEVRQGGAFEVLLHETGRLVAHGPTRLDVTRMDAEVVEITIHGLTRLRLLVTGRSHTYQLPDGSRLQVPAVATATGELPAVADIVLERPLEPGWLGGRATMTNLGEREVVWVRDSGSLTLRPGERSTLFLTPPTIHVGAPLTTSGIELVRDGTSLRGAASPNGESAANVAWCGADFQLPAGATLRLDPLQGDPFLPPPPTGIAPGGSAGSAPGGSPGGATPATSSGTPTPSSIPRQ